MFALFTKTKSQGPTVFTVQSQAYSSVVLLTPYYVMLNVKNLKHNRYKNENFLCLGYSAVKETNHAISLLSSCQLCSRYFRMEILQSNLLFNRLRGINLNISIICHFRRCDSISSQSQELCFEYITYKYTYMYMHCILQEFGLVIQLYW